MRKFAGPLISRLPVLAAVATILLILGIGTIKQGSLTAAWRPLHIPSTSPHFVDLRSITQGIDFLRSGQNPYANGSFDPEDRAFNYPPVWLYLRYLGVTPRSTNLIGTVLAILMVTSCLLLFRAKTWTGAAIVFLALCSRAVLLGLERGNIDEFIFAAMVFGFFFIDRLPSDRKFSSGLTALLIVLLTVLKIYPIVGSLIFLRSRNGIFKALLVAVASIAALLLTCGHVLPLLFANTPQDYMMSFGSFPFFLSISNIFLPASQSVFMLHRNAAPIGAVILAALSLTAALLFRDRLEQLLPRLDPDHARGRVAICGLAIFTFAFIFGASYNYRLLFLLGPLAYLVEDLNSNPSRRSLLIAGPILFLMWAPFKLTLIHEIPDGLVFVLAIAWLGTSLLPRTSHTEGVTLPQLRTLQSS